MSAPDADGDRAFMATAISLARRNQGCTWPNPTVGCVVVKDGCVVGRGVTAPGGRPHAEPQALAQAADAARGATVYVTLEPCNHTGQTPPCTEALIEAGVARVVIACSDPFMRAGEGAERLRAAGTTVDVGVLEAAAHAVNAGFFMRLDQGRPLFTLKLATTLDGAIATARGESQWITGGAARRQAHRLRAEHDAILVGANTVLADDPALTCRLPGLSPRSPLRLVLDTRLRLSPDSRLAQGAGQNPIWVFTTVDPAGDGAAALSECGVRVIQLGEAENGGGLDLTAVAATLGAEGLNSVLVEGGSAVAAGLLRAGLVDRLVWFHAGAVMGSDGLQAIAALNLPGLDAMPRFRPIGHKTIGPDLMSEFEIER